MGGPAISKQVAELALAKLGAKSITGKKMAHPEYVIFYDGKIQGRTNLRHASNRDINCEHIKKDLNVGAQFVLELAHCTKYLVDWARERGLATAAQAEEERAKREEDRKNKYEQRLEALGFAEYSGDYHKAASLPDAEFDTLFAAAQKVKLERQQQPEPPLS